MAILIETMVSIVLQLSIILIGSLLVWLWLNARQAKAATKKVAFFPFLGLHRTSGRALALGFLGGIVYVALIFAIPSVRALSVGEGTVAADTLATGISAPTVIALMAAALLKTSLTEELLFRGLIGKRLIAWLGFPIGNAIQASLFGLVHLALLLLPGTSTGVVMVLVLMTGGLGWFAGWVNERRGEGSIFPGWAAHGSANLIAYSAVAFWL